MNTKRLSAVVSKVSKEIFKENVSRKNFDEVINFIEGAVDRAIKEKVDKDLNKRLNQQLMDILDKE